MHLSFGRELQEVASMAAIVAEPRKIGKENIHHICNTTVGLSWRSLVCEGLSRHTAEEQQEQQQQEEQSKLEFR